MRQRKVQLLDHVYVHLDRSPAYVFFFSFFFFFNFTNTYLSFTGLIET